MITCTKIFFFSIFTIVIISDFSYGASPAKITGGASASIYAWPSVASIRLYKKHYCGGTFISRCHVLTAAHCLKNLNISQMDVASGSSYQKAMRNVSEIKEVELHSDFQGNATWYIHDIAIITLQTCIDENPKQKVVRLFPTYVPEGVFGTVVGWGMLSNDNVSNTLHLQQVITQTISNQQCVLIYTPEIIRYEQLCGVSGIGAGFCSGDSGGPLYINNQIAGVVSLASICGNGAPNIYTRIHPYLPWILQKIQSI